MSIVDEGATAVEYAILASAIGAVIAVIVGLIGGQVAALFNLVLQKWPT